MKRMHRVVLLLALATSTYAQFDFGGFSSGSSGGSSGGFSSGSGGSSSSSSSNDNNNGDNNNDFGSSTGNNGFDFGSFGSLSRYRTMLLAHAVLATVAFGFFFPLGGILIRLGTFPGAWRAHAMIQVLATLMYIAALVLGIFLCNASGRGLYDHYHPIIGYVLMGILIFQPISGLLHHNMFQKHRRRVLYSYFHIWLGRILITLGIVNGGLGLMFAMDYPLLPPSQAAIIGYSVGAGIMWLFYLFSIIVGEGRRQREFGTVTYKEEYDSNHSRDGRGSHSRGPRRSRSHGRSKSRVKGSRYTKSEERRRYA